MNNVHWKVRLGTVVRDMIVWTPEMKMLEAMVWNNMCSDIAPIVRNQLKFLTFEHARGANENE